MIKKAIAVALYAAMNLFLIASQTLQQTIVSLMNKLSAINKRSRLLLVLIIMILLKKLKIQTATVSHVKMILHAINVSALNRRRKLVKATVKV